MITSKVKPLILLMFFAYSLTAWALGPMKPIRLNDDVYYLQIEDIYFTSDSFDSKKQYLTDWKDFTIKKYGPFESNTVSYYDLPGSNTSDENDAIGIQVDLIESYTWLKTRYKSHK